MARKKFMLIDILIFSILAGLSEFLSTYMFNFFNAGFYISFAIMISIISIVRWSYFGIVPLLASGVVALILNQNGIMTDEPLKLYEGIIYYIIAPLFMLLSLIYLGNKNRNKRIESSFGFLIYILIAYLSLVVGKGLAILIIEHSFYGFTNYLMSIMLSLVISLIFLYLFKCKTDLICDMDEYIIDVQKEDEYEHERLESRSE